MGRTGLASGTAGDLTSRRRLLPGQSRTTTYSSELNGVRQSGVRLLAEQRRALSWPKTETTVVELQATGSCLRAELNRWPMFSVSRQANRAHPSQTFAGDWLSV